MIMIVKSITLKCCSPQTPEIRCDVDEVALAISQDGDTVVIPISYAELFLVHLQELLNLSPGGHRPPCSVMEL